MASKRRVAHQGVRVFRAKMKQQGFRKFSMWVPDTQLPKIRKGCRRQSRLASAADQSAQLADLLNVAAGSCHLNRLVSV
jgi:prophage antirepressor-like protein